MKSNINWWKIGVFAAAIIGIFLFGRSCGINSVVKTVGSDTTVKKDSFIYVDRPVPYKITDSFIYVKGFPYPVKVYDTTEGKTIILPTDTAAILKRFFDVAYYNDVRSFKRGSVAISDTVTQNRIQGRSVKLLTADTVITNSTTLVQPKRLIVYAGFDLMGTRKNPFFGGTVDLSLKDIRDRMYLLGIGRTVQGNTIYKAGMKFPIRLKKK